MATWVLAIIAMSAKMPATATFLMPTKILATIELAAEVLAVVAVAAVAPAAGALAVIGFLLLLRLLLTEVIRL